MPLTSDDVLMAYKETRQDDRSYRVCYACGYSEPSFMNIWDHTLTDCMRNTTRRLGYALPERS